MMMDDYHSGFYIAYDYDDDDEIFATLLIIYSTRSLGAFWGPIFQLVALQHCLSLTLSFEHSGRVIHDMVKLLERSLARSCVSLWIVC